MVPGLAASAIVMVSARDSVSARGLRLSGLCALEPVFGCAHFGFVYGNGTADAAGSASFTTQNSFHIQGSVSSSKSKSLVPTEFFLRLHDGLCRSSPRFAKLSN